MRNIECYTFFHNTFLPIQENQEPLPSDVAILMGTPVSSRVFASGETLGDTGARAVATANRLGSTVVAWQDVGPKVSFPELLPARWRMTERNFPEFAAESAEIIAKRLEALEVGRIVLRLHSGTGPLGTELAIALNRQKGLRVTHLPVSDPVGMRKVSFLQGLKLWHDYNTGSHKDTPREHRSGASHPTNPPLAFFTDAFVRGTSIWLRNYTYHNLITIGNEQPETAVLLHLPRHTLNGSPAEVEAMALDLGEKVKRNTFMIKLDDGYHSSEYDNPDRNAVFIGDALKISPLTEQIP